MVDLFRHMKKHGTGRSSLGRKGYLTEVPYTHPGMPEIGAVALFRTNMNREIYQANIRMSDKVTNEAMRKSPHLQQYGSVNANARRSAIGVNTIKATKNNKSPVEFRAHFNQKEFVNKVESISHAFNDLASDEIVVAMERARDETQEEIRNTQRAFKGNYKTSQSDKDDIYNALADSLNFKVLDQDETKNQFISAIGGSFDSTDSDRPTGLKGSRGGNIAIMTEKGTGPTEMRGMPLGGTARIKESLKTR